MFPIHPLGPIDYLLIGHLTHDMTPEGPRLGGTVSYASLVAQALGQRVGIVTSWASDLPLGPLQNIPMANHFADISTTFENISTPGGRVQYLRAVASPLDYYHIPEPWRTAPIVHLAPVAQEVEPAIVRQLSQSLVGVTPQGWMRQWDTTGMVSTSEWPEANFVLNRIRAAVISLDDVGRDEAVVDEFAAACRILAVTEGRQGARVFWNGDVRRFLPPQIEEVDSVGAGDIFAAAFFIRLHATRDPWEAGRFATQLASFSVTRPGFASVPTSEEIQSALIEVY